MTETESISIKPETLAQKNAADIRERITAIDLQIRDIEAEIAQIKGSLMGNWRKAAENPKDTERIAEDLEKAERRKGLFKEVREKAAADLAAAERQIKLDHFAEKRGAFESIMAQRSKRALDVAATIEQLAALINEIHRMGNEAMALFSRDAQVDGVSFDETLRVINRVHPQGHIDLFLSSRLERGLWDSSTGHRPGPNYRSEYPMKIDGERTALLVELNSAARRLAGGH